MEKLKIRASSSYKMMTDPKSKTDKEAGFLSETLYSIAKAYQMTVDESNCIS